MERTLSIFIIATTYTVTYEPFALSLYARNRCRNSGTTFIGIFNFKDKLGDKATSQTLEKRLSGRLI